MKLGKFFQKFVATLQRKVKAGPITGPVNISRSGNRRKAARSADFTPRTHLTVFEVITQKRKGNEFNTGKISASGGTENKMTAAGVTRGIMLFTRRCCQYVRWPRTFLGSVSRNRCRLPGFGAVSSDYGFIDVSDECTASAWTLKIESVSSSETSIDYTSS